MLGKITIAVTVVKPTKAGNNNDQGNVPLPTIMDDRLPQLLEKARQLPKTPGVYLMKDDKGRVIYVGKSASLRDRVCSYFQPSTTLEFKKSGLLDHVVDFDVLQTESEVEALLAENRLIKDLHPRYNARLVDD